MSTNPNDPIVDRSSLCGIMEDFHDRSGVLCLRYHGKCLFVSIGSPRHLAKGFVGAWNEKLTGDEVIFHLIVEEVFWETKGQSKYREQELPNPHCRVTGRG